MPIVLRAAREAHEQPAPRAADGHAIAALPTTIRTAAVTIPACCRASSRSRRRWSRSCWPITGCAGSASAEPSTRAEGRKKIVETAWPRCARRATAREAGGQNGGLSAQRAELSIARCAGGRNGAGGRTERRAERSAHGIVHRKAGDRTRRELIACFCPLLGQNTGLRRLSAAFWPKCGQKRALSLARRVASAELRDPRGGDEADRERTERRAERSAHGIVHRKAEVAHRELGSRRRLDGPRRNPQAQYPLGRRAARAVARRARVSAPCWQSPANRRHVPALVAIHAQHEFTRWAVAEVPHLGAHGAGKPLERRQGPAVLRRQDQRRRERGEGRGPQP